MNFISKKKKEKYYIQNKKKVLKGKCAIVNILRLFVKCTLEIDVPNI